MHKKFIVEISKILPLPKDTNIVSSDGIKNTDYAGASKKIQVLIRNFRQKYNLQEEEVLKLKEIAVKRFDAHRRSWNKIKNK